MTSATDNSQPAVTYTVGRPSFGARILAAVAHLLILGSLPGIIITAIIARVSRKASPYVQFHAKQALRWQLLFNLIFVGMLAFFLLVIVGAGFGGQGQNAGLAMDAAFLAGLVLLLLLSLPAAVFGIPAIIGAIIALFGGNFRYPLVTRRPRPSQPPGVTSARGMPTSGRV
jgi:uncharacterized Tic20 family protein